MSKHTHDLTQGPIGRKLVAFALPMLLGSLLQSGYNIVDTIFVGRLGAGAVAAVSMSFAVLFILVSLAAGLTIGASILVAQYIGAGRAAELTAVVSTSILFIFAVGIVLGAIGLAVSGPVLDLMGVPAEIRPMALSYLRWIFSGIPLLFGSFVVGAILRGAGDSRTPLNFLIVATAINIILDPLLIYGLGPFPFMGVTGAALATIIAQGVAGFLGFRHLLLAKGPVRLDLSLARFDRRIIGSILRLGLPSGLSQTIMAIGGSVLVGVVAAWGATPLAALGIGQKVDSLAIMPAMSLSQAASAMVGQNTGAALYARARRTAFVAVSIAFIGLSLIGLLVNIAPGLVLRVFTDDPAVQPIGTLYVRIVGLSYGFFGVMIVLAGAFRGAGDVLMATAIPVVSLWLFRVPLALALSRRAGLGPMGVWVAVALSAFLGAAASSAYYRWGPWQRKAVVGPELAPDLAVGE